MKLKRAHQILGVSLFASAPSIKQAYRQLIKRWHPDRYRSGSSSHTEASQMTKLINQAYSEIEHAPLRYSGDISRVQQAMAYGKGVREYLKLDCFCIASG